MILFESMVPRDRRSSVAGMIRSATGTCSVRKRFYALAASVGLVAAAQALEGWGCDQRFVTLLKEELEDIVSELSDVEGQRR